MSRLPQLALISAALLASPLAAAQSAPPAAPAATGQRATLSALPLSVESNARLYALTSAGIKQAFPGNSQPEAVFLSEDRKVTVSLEWRSSKLAQTEVPGLLTSFGNVIRSQVPGLKSFKAQPATIGGSTWSQFVFVAPGKVGDVRRELLITSLQGRMLVVTVSGLVADYSRNETPIRALVNSIRLGS